MCPRHFQRLTILHAMRLGVSIFHVDYFFMSNTSSNHENGGCLRNLWKNLIFENKLVKNETKNFENSFFAIFFITNAILLCQI